MVVVFGVTGRTGRELVRQPTGRWQAFRPATSGVHTYNREFQEEIWRVSNELVGLDELAPSF